MLTFFKWTGIIFSVCILLYAILAFLFFQMFNVAPRTEKRVKKEYKNSVLATSVTVVEADIEKSPLDNYFVSPSLRRVESTGYLLENDGTFTESVYGFNADIHRQYSILNTEDYSLIYKDGALYEFVDSKVGKVVEGWADLPFDTARYIAAINSKHLLVEAHQGNPHESTLFQISYPELEIISLTRDPYYTHNRAPLRFESVDKSAIVIVYFEGSYDYAFGGDSSRPKKSIVRLYNEKHPEGLDLVAFSFASGTVVDVKFEKDGLFVMTDPSRPAQSRKPRLPPRFWRITVAN